MADQNTNPKPPAQEPTPKGIAADKLKKIALSFSPSAPDEHVVFGGGGIKFNRGDLRDITGTRRQ